MSTIDKTVDRDDVKVGQTYLGVINESWSVQLSGVDASGYAKDRNLVRGKAVQVKVFEGRQAKQVRMNEETPQNMT